MTCETRAGYIVTIITLLFLLALILTGCTGGEGNLPDNADPASVGTGEITGQVTWPDALPADGIQPWESINEQGYVLLPPFDVGKSPSAINPDSEFFAGVERYNEAGDVSANGEASRVTSGVPDGGGLSWAQYRFTMVGEEPGCISADVNLLSRDDGSTSEYWLGLAHYSIDAWEWHGPFTDSHVRISTGADVRVGGSYLSALGNLFVTVVAFDGSSFDVVGIGVNQIDESDLSAPPVPAGITITPRAGALELTWNDVLTGDLGGYNIYYRNGSFTAVDTTGVEHVGYVSGATRLVVDGLAGETYFRLSAVDLSGNESNLSELVSATPLAGFPPNLSVSVDATGGLVGDAITLTASGADTYDYDLDGDGIFEITDSASASQPVDTGAAGVIRPAVRGSTGGGDAVALGAVSLLLGGNSRPIAIAYADPAFGFAPLDVTFTGTGHDYDGEVVGYAWDFNGDGTFDWVNAADPNPPVHQYVASGFFNAKFRVIDDSSAWAVDTVGIDVRDNIPPFAVIEADGTTGSAPLTVEFDASGSYDLDGEIVLYEWDLNGNGSYETDTGAVSQTSGYFSAIGETQVGLRITDDNGEIGTATIPVTVHGWVRRTIHSDGTSGNFSSLALIDGHPAIAFFKSDSDELMYVRAINPTGQDVPWDAETVHVVGASDVYTSLAEVDGAPAIAYYDDVNNELHYTRAQNASGIAVPWDDEIVDTNGDAGSHCDMEVVSGRPAISYYEAGTEELRYARAQNSTGIATIWDTLTVRAAAGDGYGFYTDLEVVVGNPAITYSDNGGGSQLYSRSINSTGLSGSWTHRTIESIDGAFGQLEVADGRPVVAYRGFLSYLVFDRAAEAYGTATGWKSIDLDTDLWTGYHISMAIIDGCPAVCWMDVDDETLEYIRSVTPDGGHLMSWTERITVDENLGLIAASDQYATSMIDINGRPAIAYRDNNSHDLKYAILF